MSHRRCVGLRPLPPPSPPHLNVVFDVGRASRRIDPQKRHSIKHACPKKKSTLGGPGGNTLGVTGPSCVDFRETLKTRTTRWPVHLADVILWMRGAVVLTSGFFFIVGEICFPDYSSQPWTPKFHIRLLFVALCQNREDKKCRSVVVLWTWRHVSKVIELMFRAAIFSQG